MPSSPLSCLQPHVLVPGAVWEGMSALLCSCQVTRYAPGHAAGHDNTTRRVFPGSSGDSGRFDVVKEDCQPASGRELVQARQKESIYLHHEPHPIPTLYDHGCVYASRRHLPLRDRPESESYERNDRGSRRSTLAGVFSEWAIWLVLYPSASHRLHRIDDFRAWSKRKMLATKRQDMSKTKRTTIAI